jgi:hypothetical protein
MKDDGIQIKGIKTPHIIALFVGLGFLLFVLLTGRFPAIPDQPNEITVQAKK